MRIFVVLIRICINYIREIKGNEVRFLQIPMSKRNRNRQRRRQQQQRKKLLSTQKWNTTLFIFFRIAIRVNDTKKANVSFGENVPGSNVKRLKMANAKRMSLIG